MLFTNTFWTFFTNNLCFSILLQRTSEAEVCSVLGFLALQQSDEIKGRFTKLRTNVIYALHCKRPNRTNVINRKAVDVTDHKQTNHKDSKVSKPFDIIYLFWVNKTIMCFEKAIREILSLTAFSRRKCEWRYLWNKF